MRSGRRRSSTPTPWRPGTSTRACPSPCSTRTPSPPATSTAAMSTRGARGSRRSTTCASASRPWRGPRWKAASPACCECAALGGKGLRARETRAQPLDGNPGLRRDRALAADAGATAPAPPPRHRRNAAAGPCSSRTSSAASSAFHGGTRISLMTGGDLLRCASPFTAASRECRLPHRTPQSRTGPPNGARIELEREF